MGDGELYERLVEAAARAAWVRTWEMEDAEEEWGDLNEWGKERCREEMRAALDIILNLRSESGERVIIELLMEHIPTGATINDVQVRMVDELWRTTRDVWVSRVMDPTQEGEGT